MFIKSRVDSRKPFVKAEWILAKCLPSRVDSCKPFVKAEWILAKCLPSRVDSRKCFIKPSGFSQIFTKPSGFSQIFTKQFLFCPLHIFFTPSFNHVVSYLHDLKIPLIPMWFNSSRSCREPLIVVSCAPTTTLLPSSVVGVTLCVNSYKRVNFYFNCSNVPMLSY